ncbi:hypothetical protein ACTWQB_16815 [Piscibacillus sp. B03]
MDKELIISQAKEDLITWIQQLTFDNLEESFEQIRQYEAFLFQLATLKEL